MIHPVKDHIAALFPANDPRGFGLQTPHPGRHTSLALRSMARAAGVDYTLVHAAFAQADLSELVERGSKFRWKAEDLVDLREFLLRERDHVPAGHLQAAADRAIAHLSRALAVDAAGRQLPQDEWDTPRLTASGDGYRRGVAQPYEALRNRPSKAQRVTHAVEKRWVTPVVDSLTLEALRVANRVSKPARRTGVRAQPRRYSPVRITHPDLTHETRTQIPRESFVRFPVQRDGSTWALLHPDYVNSSADLAVHYAELLRHGFPGGQLEARLFGSAMCRPVTQRLLRKDGTLDENLTTVYGGDASERAEARPAHLIRRESDGVWGVRDSISEEITLYEGPDSVFAALQHAVGLARRNGMDRGVPAPETIEAIRAVVAQRCLGIYAYQLPKDAAKGPLVANPAPLPLEYVLEHCVALFKHELAQHQQHASEAEREQLRRDMAAVDEAYPYTPYPNVEQKAAIETYIERMKEQTTYGNQLAAETVGMLANARVRFWDKDTDTRQIGLRTIYEPPEGSNADRTIDLINIERVHYTCVTQWDASLELPTRTDANPVVVPFGKFREYDAGGVGDCLFRAVSVSLDGPTERGALIERADGWRQAVVESWASRLANAQRGDGSEELAVALNRYIYDE